MASRPLRIVSLADRGGVGRIHGRDWLALGRRLGRPVSFQHLCLPPSPVLLSDLKVLADAGAMRDRPRFAAVNAAWRTLHDASLLIVDDVADFAIPINCAYGALAADRRRDPLTDLITVRRQRYPAFHHLLPTTFVAGIDLPLAGRTAAINAIARLLDKPVFRIATLGTYQAFTRGWDFRRVDTPAGTSGGRVVFDPSDLLDALTAWISAVDPPAAADLPDPPLDVSDLGHYCSHLIDRVAIDLLLDAHDRFCIAGQTSSAPYVRARLDALGKPWVAAPHYDAAGLARTDPAAYDVIVSLGPQGNHATPRPVASVDATGPLGNALGNESYTVKAVEMPPSRSNWHAPLLDRRRSLHFARAFATAQATDEAAVLSARLAARAARPRRGTPRRLPIRSDRR